MSDNNDLCLRHKTCKLVEDLRLQVKFYLQVPPARKMHVLLKE